MEDKQMSGFPCYA